MENYYVPIMQLVLTKLDKSKSEAFNARFVRLYHFVSSKTDLGLGADFFIKILDSIQQGCVISSRSWKLANPRSIYVPIYLNIVLPGTPKLARPLDRKTAVVSLTRTLTDSVAFSETYKKGWAFTCDRLLELLINPPVIAEADDIIAEHDVDDMSFGVGFTQLVTVKRPAKDNFPEIDNVKSWVGQTLQDGDARHGGRISTYVQERLTPESRQALMAYMQT
jgi:exportin-2 (importin alpha re-exporter)